MTFLLILTALNTVGIVYLFAHDELIRRRIEHFFNARIDAVIDKMIKVTEVLEEQIMEATNDPNTTR